MQRRKRALSQPSDIAFLLIIFFLLLAGVAADRMLVVTPSSREDSASDSPVDIDQSPVIVQVADDGSLRFSDGMMHTDVQDRDVVMRVSGTTQWEYVVKALDTISRFGAQSISCELWGPQ